jgi:hypothetical protein
MHSEKAAIGAQVGVSALASRAIAAGEDRVADHAISGCEADYVSADHFDDAAELVPHDEGWWSTRALLSKGFQFAAADACGGDSQQDLVGSQFRDWLIGHFKALPI